ncbi:hypothetical protein Dda_5231 [Drechslerella dactyloides]|uniref:Uncharacterized protein n=1 Tax=Drechslerella dactyloides TaxID=74499 RepID=A0AAD6IVP7_DREDA|nr:hypothetical protein Dda_5231 [Drechslerella dactyloides]
MQLRGASSRGTVTRRRSKLPLEQVLDVKLRPCILHRKFSKNKVQPKPTPPQYDNPGNRA